MQAGVVVVGGSKDHSVLLCFKVTEQIRIQDPPLPIPSPIPDFGPNHEK